MNNSQMEYKFVSFDVVNGTFNFYTQVGWDNFLAGVRKWLGWVSPCDTEWETVDAYELLQAMYGEEFFWEEIE